MVSNQKGFSLIQITVAMGLLGGLALLSMQIMDSVKKNALKMNSLNEEVSIVNQINLILSHPKHCRISLAGEGPEGNPNNPVTFKKQNVDEEQKNNEGIDVSFYFADSTGEKRARELSVSPIVKIKSAKLYLPNRVDKDKPSKLNYDNSLSHTDFGEIVVTLDRMHSNSIKKRFGVSVWLETKSSKTTILGCKQASSNPVLGFICPSIPSTGCRFGGGRKGCPPSKCKGQIGDEAICFYYENVAGHASCREHGSKCEQRIAPCRLLTN